MVVVYRFLGLIADFALHHLRHIALGRIQPVPVTLTLPGIAGMILTIGVAADANVVVFERIKEEVRRGKTVRSAITRATAWVQDHPGRQRPHIAYRGGAVLLPTGQPKGFSVTLIIGVLEPVHRSAATRAMLGLLSDYDFFNKASFMGVSAAQMAATAATQAAEAEAAPSRSASSRAYTRSSAARKKKKRR